MSVPTPAAAAPAVSHTTPALWIAPAVAASAAGLAFVVYLSGLAPGLTWAHEAADGGDLLAAAVANGVPHPPGYPLYTLLLQGWLALVGVAAPASDLAWRGNLLSALCGAGSVFLTVLTAHALLPPGRSRTLWAGLAGLLWGLTTLLWSQSLVTEVYTLHALLVALLGWAALVQAQRRRWPLFFPVALGVAHHLTLLLLLPAAFYAVWGRTQSRRAALAALGWIALGLLLGVLLYLRIPLVARHAPPVNWGYADSWAGLWWLVSGQAYRGYLFGVPAAQLPAQLLQAVRLLAGEYSLAGLAIALWGLAHWDAHQPHLRTFSLLWLLPVFAYSVGYHSRDNLLYLLPFVWLLALWLAVGIDQLAGFAARRRPQFPVVPLVGTMGLLLVVVTLLVRGPALSLRGDDAARAFLRGAAAVLEPESILVSRSDAETFALWYGTWGSGELADAAPGLVPVNDWLYQFAWYGRLQADLHPNLPGAGRSVEALLAANAGAVPIFLAEDLPIVPSGARTPEPPLWRFLPPE